MHRTRFSNAGGGRGDLEPQGRRKEAGSLAGVGPFLQTLVWVQGTQPLLPAEEGPWIPEEMSQRPSEHPSCSTSWKERGTGQGGGPRGLPRARASAGTQARSCAPGRESVLLAPEPATATEVQ